MTRRKGERPLVRTVMPYDASHPVARNIGEGTPPFTAWMQQEATPYYVLVKRTRIPLDRIMTLDRGAVPTDAELAALAAAWHTTVDILKISFGTPASIAK